MINYSVRRYEATELGGTESEYYKAVAQYTDTMDLNAFAKHIADHGSVYSRADVAAVITLAVDCLRELVLEGYRVTLGDLGTFFARLSSVNTVTEKSAFTSGDITKCVIAWTRDTNFTNLIEDAEFNQVLSRAEQAAALAASKVSDDLTGELEAISGAAADDGTGDSDGTGEDTGDSSSGDEEDSGDEDA